jgi:phospholipid/cholesterol/gamma-HCH transport system substrate-binding protein
MKNRNVSVGLFVAGGLLLFGAGLFLIGDRRQAFGRHVEYYSEFVNLAGLSNGAEVRVGGLDAGEVLAIDVLGSPSSRFRVRWRIGEKLRGLVRTDSMVTIETEGVVGGTYLAVRPGTSHALPASALATIPSMEPVELSEILMRGSALLNEAQSTLSSVGGKLGSTLDTVNNTVSNVNDIAVGLKQGRGPAGMLLTDDALAKRIRQTVVTSASSIDEILAGLKAGRGAAGMLLRDEAVEGQIRQSLENVEQATANLDHASHQADALISDLNSQQMPQKIAAAVTGLAATAKKADQMVSEIVQPDRQGVTAGTNIRESLMNANTATLNLADSTEALKHNFLVRGFFRSRGYYNLDRIEPAKYRQDAAFTSNANYRAWLSATELFQAGSNGDEELSAAGKALLDSSLAEGGEFIFEGPIVIEGYCSGNGSADQLRLSRIRAILVRQYLQSHFQLDSNNLGVVPLKSIPPNGAGRTTWDGICIVVLRKRSK